MARTARSVHARKKRRKVLEQAKGYRGTKHSSYKRAKEQVWKSGVYAYDGRKQRKSDFRALGSNASTPAPATAPLLRRLSTG